MKDQYLFFRSNGYDFCLDQSEFEAPIRLDLHEIKPTEISAALWEYHSIKDRKEKGLFLHFGYLMGFFPIEILQSGMIYRQKKPNPGNLSLYVDQVVGYMPVDKMTTPKKEVGDLKRLPPGMPTTAIRWYLPWRGRNLLLIEPSRIFEAYKIMESGRLYNLADQFSEFKS